MSKFFKSPVFVLRWLNASVMRWPASAIIVNLFYSIAMKFTNGTGRDTVHASNICIILFALVWGFVFTLLTPPLSQRRDIDDAGLLGRGIYGVFCFVLFANAENGIAKLVLLFCIVESVINILITRKSAHKKKEKSEGEILINLAAEGKIDVKNMLNRELIAMFETAKDYDTMALLEELLEKHDELADVQLNKLGKKEDVYVLPKEKDSKGRTFTKLRYSEGEVKSNGVIVTKRGVFSLNIIYDDIRLKSQSEEMFRVERPQGQPVDVRPYLSEIFNTYKALSHITQFKHTLINIVVAPNNGDMMDMIEFHKMPVIVTGLENLEYIISNLNDKEGRYSPEEVKEIYEMIEKHVVKEGVAK